MPDEQTQIRDYLNDIAPPRFDVDEIIERSEGVTTLAPMRVARERRAWVVGVATGLATLVLVGGGALLLRLVEFDDPPVADEPVPTAAPVITAPSSPTTTASVPASLTPEMTWTRVSAQDDMFNGEGLDDGWQSINDVIAGGPGLIAVGVDTSGGDDDAAVWYSEDGISWTRVPHDEDVFGGPGNQTMRAITLGGPGLVAVGGDGMPTDGAAESLHEILGQNAAVWFSADGITWNRAPASDALTVSDGAIVMKDVIRGGPGLVAVGARSHRADDALAMSDFGGSVTSIYQDLDAVVWTSEDGINWQRAPHDDSVFGDDDTWHDMRAVARGGPGLVAVGAAGFDLIGPPSETLATAAVWTSIDGLVWTRVPFDDAFKYGADFTVMNDVTSNGGVLIAVGLAEVPQEPLMWSSSDGVAWNTVSPDSPDGLIPRVDGVAVHDGTLVAVGKGADNGPATVWFSTDEGATWVHQPWDCDVLGAGPPGSRPCGTSPTWMSAVAGFDSSFIAVGTSAFDAAVWIGELNRPDG